MFKVIKKQIRPNTSVNFYSITDLEFIQWLKVNYYQNGKMLLPKSTLSEDRLELTTEVYFQSSEVAREWKYNPYVYEKFHLPQETYCVENGIELLPTITIGEVSEIK